MKRLLPVAATIAAFSLTLSLRADTPGIYAIQGARIVTAAGLAVESMAVVVASFALTVTGIACANELDIRS